MASRSEAGFKLVPKFGANYDSPAGRSCRGSVNENVVPFPGSLSTEMAPRWASTASLQKVTVIARSPKRSFTCSIETCGFMKVTH